ncbi:MAG TPA: hypothetical protein VF155_00600, partial [Candidatus Dormibacteraeota bacterium]
GHMHPLLITFLDDGEALWGELSYKVDFYEPSTIEQLGATLERILAAAVRDSSMRLSALAPAFPSGAREVAVGRR